MLTRPPAVQTHQTVHKTKNPVIIWEEPSADFNTFAKKFAQSQQRAKRCGAHMVTCVRNLQRNETIDHGRLSLTIHSAIRLQLQIRGVRVDTEARGECGGGVQPSQSAPCVATARSNLHRPRRPHQDYPQDASRVPRSQCGADVGRCSTSRLLAAGIPLRPAATVAPAHRD